MNQYDSYDALGLAELVKKGETSSQELLDEAMKRSEKAQSDLNCFSAVFPEIAQSQIDAGLPEGPLSGVPFATKDLAVAITDAPLTNGSVAYKGNICTGDSEITKRYRKAGLLLMGQTTSPEFGLTTSTESNLYGQTRNPWDLTRTSGGSSGGASATVAAGVMPLAQASDGGGSIRIPAACTGLFGMKPSRGRIPMGPERTEGWNGLSTVHAVSRSVRDNAALMDVTHGPEFGSRYAAPEAPISFLDASNIDPRPLRVAVWREAPNGTMPDADAEAGLQTTIKLLEGLGHTVEESGPQLDGDALGKSMLMVISANMALVKEMREAELGRELPEDAFELVTQQMMSFGNSVPMKEVARADATFMKAAILFDTWMVNCGFDVVLMPTLSRKPDKLGVLSLSPADADAYAKAVTSFAPHCGLFNQMGAPAMSVPLHWTDDNVPLGMMFGARFGHEAMLYSLGGQLERAAPWWDRKPPVWTGA